MSQSTARSPVKPASKPKSAWNDPKVRGIFYQVLVVGLVALGVWYLVSNTLHNLSVRNIATGFGFLAREAGFAIGEGPISYTPEDTYSRALTVGLLNTLRAAAIGIVLATILGTIIGIARLSSNWLVAKLASIYVEVMRNVPLLLQLFFWYAIISESFPGPLSLKE
ncbi:MAG TPA: ABC transporter permease subunit, partial [Orrella sp.]